MDAYKKLELFPDNWVRKMTPEEVDESRQQLKAYTISNSLEKGLKEVAINFRFFGGKEAPNHPEEGVEGWTRPECYPPIK